MLVFVQFAANCFGTLVEKCEIRSEVSIAMNKLLLLLILYFLVVVATTAASTSVHSPPTLTEQVVHHDQNAVQFDHFVLALTWPNSYCKILQSNPDPTTRRCLHTDYQNLQQFFTIHGLWPTLSGGYSVPLSSCTAPAFNISKLVSNPKLYARANQYWPNVKKSAGGRTPAGKSNGFWEHEWKSHGICSNLEQNDFMDLALNIYQNLINPKIGGVVRHHRTSKKTVNTTEFKDELKKSIGAKPRMVCRNQYLSEIQFHIEKSAPYKFIPAGNSNCATSSLANFP